MPKERLVSYFYEGLTSQGRQVVEMMCNGEFRDKSPEDALDYLDYIAENAQHWDTVGSYESSSKPQSSPFSGVSKGQIHIHTPKLTTLVGETTQIVVGEIEKRKFPAQPELNPKSQQHPQMGNSGNQNMSQVKSVITLCDGKVVKKYIMDPHETSKDGRPFLGTTNALINCKNELMNLSFGNMTLELNVFNMCKQPHHQEDDDNENEEIDLIESIIEEQYANIVNYLTTCEIPCDWSSQNKKKFLTKVKSFYWDDPYLFKYCSDQIFRRCIPDDEVSRVIQFCHSEARSDHFSSKKTAAKILLCGFYWPTLFKDSHAFCRVCTNCQMVRSISKRNMMPLNPILVIEIFDCWGIDFMGPFPSSFGFVYILVTVDYISKWIEAIPCWHNDHKIMIRFLKENLLSRFGIPRAIISDGGKHFCNKPFESLMKKYGITYKVAIPYHSQTSGQECHPISLFMENLAIYQLNLNVNHFGRLKLLIEILKMLES
ncbi:uncharacterized protein LOC112095634 [Citrus clementina]|uniref:uncharacterized protein LOC112095634 n=1 Tax=Citrus clementina TaxID=85681 RepID=UPI000CECF364|nr:uncharacterized protein LOC112095634 [Citrus x clementina]